MWIEKLENPEEQNWKKILEWLWINKDDISKLDKKHINNIWELNWKVPENIDNAIDKRLTTEINKIWSWVNQDKLNEVKKEALNKIKEIQDPKEKLIAYSEFLEWLKSNVWTIVWSQKKLENDKIENDKIENEENKKKFDFKEMWKKMREELDKITREKILSDLARWQYVRNLIEPRPISIDDTWPNPKWIQEKNLN